MSDTLNEVWSIDLGSSKQRRRLVGRAAIGDTLVLITASDHNGACHWQTIALTNGRVTGTGLVPGLFITDRDQTVSATAVGNTLLCAINDGVIGLSAIPNVAAPQNPIASAITLARTQTTQQGEGDTFLALYATPKAPALSTSNAMIVDGLLNDWKNISTTALDAPRQNNKSVNNARDITGQIGIQWDANFVYVGLAIQDDIFQPPVPGAELRSGDSIVIGIDPEANDDPQSRPIVLALGLVNGQTQMVMVQGQSLNLNLDDSTTPTESANIMARLVRQADGYTGEIAIPWSMLRPNPRERPGHRSNLGLSALVFDHDGEKIQHASWGAGLAHAIDARRFARVICMDLTGERIAGYRRFIEQMPDHEFAWRFTERIAATHMGDAQLPAQIAEVEQFITRAPNVPSTAAALATLVCFHRLAGHPDPIAETLTFAKRAKIPDTTIGDGVGPQTDGKGRALRQWVWIDPQNPPLALMVQIRSKQSDWNHRAYWGSDLMPWGQANTSQRWPMGLLPETGKWVSLIIPIAAVGLNNADIQNISFVSHSGNVRWGVSEWLENGNVTTLVDPSTNPRFDRQIEFATQDGRPSHGLKKQGGEAAYHLKDNSLTIIT